jgi:hypothetical protein
MKTETKTKTISHPLDDTFDIVPNTTVVEYTEAVPAVIVEMPNYDVKDDEIEGMLQTVFDTAMLNAEDAADSMGQVEGKYKARVGEVSAANLSVALGAASTKAQLKMHKDKLQANTRAPGAPNTVNNNLIITDRNELLRKIIKNKIEQQ